MACRGEPIQVVVAEIPDPAPIGQTRAIANAVIEIVRFIDLRTRRRELMQDIGHLRGGIIGVRRLGAVGQGYRRAPREANVMIPYQVLSALVSLSSINTRQ